MRIEEITEDLRAWFGKGKKGGAGGGGWDRYNTKGERIGKCGDSKPGEGKPKCLSKSAAAKLRNADKDGDGKKDGKSGIARAVKRKKSKDPNRNRKGKAKNITNEAPAMRSPKLPKELKKNPYVQPVTYIGPNSTKWDADKARQAQKMERDGASPEDIWKKTRTLRGFDGALRQELDDSTSKITLDTPDIATIDPETYKPTSGRVYKADEVFDHPELYDAYPELRDYNVVFYDNSNDLNSRGWLNGRSNTIGIGAYDRDSKGSDKPVPISKSEIRSVLAHELGGHGVQDLEPDFEIGGRPNSKETMDIADTIRNSYLDFTKKERGSIFDLDFDVYQGYAGEIDARSIQNRLDMDDEERSQNMPKFDDSPIIVLRSGEPPSHLSNRPSKQSFRPSLFGKIFGNKPNATVLHNPNYSGDRKPKSPPPPPPSGLPQQPQKPPKPQTPPVRKGPPPPPGLPPKPSKPSTPTLATPKPPVAKPSTWPPGTGGQTKSGSNKNMILPGTNNFLTTPINASAMTRANKIFKESYKKLNNK